MKLRPVIVKKPFAGGDTWVMRKATPTVAVTGESIRTSMETDPPGRILAVVADPPATTNRDVGSPLTPSADSDTVAASVPAIAASPHRLAFPMLAPDPVE